MIALLCPSRGRPEQLRRMIESVKAASSAPIIIYMSLSELAGNYFDWALSYQNCPRVRFATYRHPDNLPTVHKWNLLAEQALKNPDNKLFMLASDDMIFETPGWDKALIDHYNQLPKARTMRKQPHVYALQDSRDENGTPHPIVTREYIEAIGYFMPPWFLHWYCDSWTVEMAKGYCAKYCAFTHLKDYKLIHDKPSDKGKGDETHNRIRDFGWHERDKAVDKLMRDRGLLAHEMRRFWDLSRTDIEETELKAL